MKKISDQRRVLDLAFAANSREEIDSIIETLKGVAENRFPIERKTRKRRAKPGTTSTSDNISVGSTVAPKQKAKAKAAAADDGDPDWLTRHPEPES